MPIEVVLACDPGKKDYAWSLVALDGTVVDTGMIKHVIDDLTHRTFLLQFAAYVKELRSILKRRDIKIVAACIERLTPRPGMGGGAAAEFVNVMVGIFYVVCSQHNVNTLRPVMPGQWKGWLAKMYNGEKALESSPIALGFPQVIKLARKSDNFPIFEHQFDSIGIGLWWVCNCVSGPRQTLDVKIQQKNYMRTKLSIKKLWKERLNRGRT